MMCSLFVGCFSFFVFKRRQYLYQWLGILACVCGLVIVGYAGAHNTQAATSASKAILGTALVVLGMLSSAVQMVVEEKYLKGRNLPPAFVVGTEGCFGIIVMTCIVLPIVAHVPGRGTSDIIVSTKQLCQYVHALLLDVCLTLSQVCLAVVK